MVNLDFLETFLVAADLGTFRGAATTRGITVSAISQQIKALEGQLAVPLFERVGRRVELTTHGRDLARALRPAFQQISAALGALDRSFQQISGVVRLGTPRAFGRHWTRSRLARVLVAHQDLRVKFTLGTPLSLERKLLEGEIDLALLVRPPSVPTLDGKPLAEESFAAVAAPSYLQRFGAPHTEDELRRARFGVFDEGHSMLGPWWRARFGAEARLPEDVVVEVSDLDALLDLALDGVCITVLPTYLVEPHLHEGRLVRVSVSGERRVEVPSHTIHLAWRRAAVLPARVRVVREALLTH